MNAWLAGHFFNPAFVASGMLLLASPIIIHLINRMRYRRVQFAAMEFLLASQQRNRRRLLLEQLLLLLLRMLIVIAIVLLISRLILDPSQMSVFRGARAHHVVLLDDSLSMRDRWSETSSFAEALKIVNRLVAGGAEQPNTQKLTLLRLSRPEQPVLSERDVNEDFVTELSAKLDQQAFPCTHRALDLVTGLQAAGKLLAGERGTIQNLHVISDFRERDWQDQKAISAAIDQLTSAGVSVNLVRTVPEQHPNLAVTHLSGDIQVAAADVPLRLKVAVKNSGQQVATDVRLAMFDNDEKIPASVVFEKIDPMTEVSHEVDVRLTTAGRHRLKVSIDTDSLVEDNARFLAVDVPKTVPVLIIDGDPSGDDGSYIAEALAADPKSTGFAPVIENVEYLRRRPLDDFRAIYLLNVPEIPADGLDALEKYVAAGGGLAWFVGPTLRPAHYNDVLYRKGEGLFPVPLDAAPEVLTEDATNPGADMQVVDHPALRLFAIDNTSLPKIRIEKYFPVSEDWKKDDQVRKDRVRTLATVRNGDPLMLEHTFGKGHVITMLTTASPDWNNWATDYSYVVVQLELMKYIARTDRSPEARQVGELIQLSLNPADYTETVEILSPGVEGERTTRLQAAPEQNETNISNPPPLRLSATFRETDDPGIYTVRLMTQAQVGEDRLIAYNVAPRESDLQLAATADIRKRLGGNDKVTIQDFGQLEWVQGKEAGSEIRQWILWTLLFLMIAEQALAYRLSYHRTNAAAKPNSSGRRSETARRTTTSV
ncbi:MAG: hypothetical protein JWP89_1730 [Schlesneria sp.]|nr:hypothetical protein [Schlesneria sp.]